MRFLELSPSFWLDPYSAVFDALLNKDTRELLAAEDGEMI